MKFIKNKKKRIYMWLGICLLTGSLSACGSDMSVSTEAVDYSQLIEPISKESLETSENPQESSRETLQDENMTNVSDWNNSPATAEDSTVSSADSSTENSPTEGSLKEDETDSSAEPREDIITITISAAGDATLGTHQDQYGYSFRQVYDTEQNAGYFFENVLDIFSEDDMTIVNLEGPLTASTDAREGQVYSIKGDPEYVNILTAGSVEAVSMGNNHRLDYKEQGCKDTVTALEGAEIAYAYDDIVGIYETKGLRIGFVSVNEVAWGSGVEKLIEEGIAKLQEAEVNLILVCCHWGIEREYYPENYQKSLGRKCIDWGADLVIGHHPHVLQGIEEYQGKYIIYSLGNFCFGANRNPADKDSMIFQQTFTFENGVKAEDEDVRIIPCSISSVSNINDFKPTPAIGEEAVRIINRVNEFSKDFGVQFDEAGVIIGG